MKLHPLALSGCVIGLALIPTACHLPEQEKPSFPTMANPPPDPVPTPVSQPAIAATAPENLPPPPPPGPVPVPTAPASPPMAGAPANVPGAPDPWAQIQNFGYDKRAAFAAEIDNSMTLFSGASSVARLSLPKPGMADTHSADVQQLDAAVASLSQARAALNYSDPGSWDSAKNNLHTAWQNAQDAYAKVRASGN
jgi:hypothetical protein